MLWRYSRFAEFRKTNFERWCFQLSIFGWQRAKNRSRFMSKATQLGSWMGWRSTTKDPHLRSPWRCPIVARLTYTAQPSIWPGTWGDTNNVFRGIAFRHSMENNCILLSGLGTYFCYLFRVISANSFCVWGQQHTYRLLHFTFHGQSSLLSYSLHSLAATCATLLLVLPGAIYASSSAIYVDGRTSFDGNSALFGGKVQFR